MPWPPNPVVHEIFTWVWLADLGEQLGRRVTLADVPERVWDDVASPGIDAVWLMGVWERSPHGASLARANPSLQTAHLDALPDLVDDDVVGSAYCIRRYAVDDRLGGDTGLATARAALAARGVRLILDLVPNHMAPDHPWTREHPEYFIHGSADDLRRDPLSFVQVGEHVLACGRDPYFPAWPDVVQLDASRADVRAAMAELMVALTQVCDGVRCDMAMLMLDDVFASTWGNRATGAAPPDQGSGFWPTVIGAARAARPDFAMWAEAYWGLEPVLVEQGFDACYDKRLYDRLLHGTPIAEVRAHLSAPLTEQHHTIRFIENHDEPRAAALLSPAAHRATLIALLTLPGIALLHEGGAEGRKVRVPVTLGRRPAEALDASLHDHVHHVLGLVAGMRAGQWSLATVDGWPDNHSADRLLAWAWTDGANRHLVVLNLTDHGADGRVRLPWNDLGATTLHLTDLLTAAQYERDAAGVAADGLYVALDGAAAHLFRVQPAQ